MKRRLLPAVLLAAAPFAHAALPAVQPGQWVLKSKINGQPHETKICGNPLDKVAAAIAAARETEKLGCSVRIETPVPRTVNVAVDCPADRASADGTQPRAQRHRRAQRQRRLHAIRLDRPAPRRPPRNHRRRARGRLQLSAESPRKR